MKNFINFLKELIEFIKASLGYTIVTTLTIILALVLFKALFAMYF